MDNIYAPLKLAHIGLVSASGLLFAARGAAVLAGQAWAMHRPWRLLSVTIDSLLLAAGVGLAVLLALNPVHSAWLTTKLTLLLLYIVLGSLALKRGRTPAIRRWTYAGALATYAFMVGIALHHHPLGWFSG